MDSFVSGVHMRVLLPELPGGTTRVSPLVLAIQGRYQEDPDLEYELPNTIQALLMGVLLTT